ncbi:hypothetical protein [Mesorhizobium sp. DCY119]|uniref:hypothetical protein n=1 Tax=Mesorhizobium sp. DCY119 TaxID=2108445 RepID=UPI000E6C211C|nr:hypothetical protein [Mesorhizobium sp. DCY119]RJG46644.1 hypothetical protein D3Y55_21905 [Mesorhizobium sp. DCY119]
MSDDGDKPKPRLRVVVENDSIEVRKEQYRWLFDQPLRELAANIIRTSRGAGKPYDILGECIEVVKKFQEYREVVGHWPSSFDIQASLAVRKTYDFDNPQYFDEIDYSAETVISGALRVSAARLVGQDLQERHGEKELWQGIDAVERHREEMRAKRAAELRAARSSTAKPRKAPKKRAKK